MYPVGVAPLPQQLAAGVVTGAAIGEAVHVRNEVANTGAEPRRHPSVATNVERLRGDRRAPRPPVPRHEVHRITGGRPAPLPIRAPADRRRQVRLHRKRPYPAELHRSNVTRFPTSRRVAAPSRWATFPGPAHKPWPGPGPDVPDPVARFWSVLERPAGRLGSNNDDGAAPSRHRAPCRAGELGPSGRAAMLRRHRVPLVDVLEEHACLHLEHVGGVGARESVVEGLLDGVPDARAGLRGLLPVDRQEPT